MPRHVDESTRLTQIVDAVLRVVARGGVDAVTFRSVAAEMGASTTVITHFVPDREALIRRAFESLRAALQASQAVALGHDTPRARLKGLMATGLSLDGDVACWLAYGQFMLQQEFPAFQMAAWVDAAAHREALRRQLQDLPLRVPLGVALDLCATISDGVTTSVLMDPGSWPATRQIDTLDGLLDALIDGGLQKSL